MGRKFEFDRPMTAGDLIDYLLRFDSDTPVLSSVFRPGEGLIYKAPIKFAQLKTGRDCVYLNTYLQK